MHQPISYEDYRAFVRGIAPKRAEELLNRYYPMSHWWETKGWFLYGARR